MASVKKATRISTDLADKLKKMASEVGTSESTIIAVALHHYINRRLGVSSEEKIDPIPIVNW